MAGLGAVQVRLELGHRAQVRKKPTAEGFTHDWMVFVRGPEHSNIQHFVEKVVFHLHESFPKPKRVCKDPPYKVEESGYAGFILPIEVYFRNKEEPKKVRFDYDLFLHLEGHPPVNHLRCEKLTFNNPTEEFRRKLLKAGGQRDPHKRSSEDSKVMVMQEGSTSLFGQHMKLPTLPSSSLTFSFPDLKRTKPFPGPKDGARSTLSLTTSSSSSSSTSSSKLAKPGKEHRDKPPRASKDPHSAFREPGRDGSKPPKDSSLSTSSSNTSRKPKDLHSQNQNLPLREDHHAHNPHHHHPHHPHHPPPKMGFKEPKGLAKDPRGPDGGVGVTMVTTGAGLGKRTPGDTGIGDDHVSKKRKKSSGFPSSGEGGHPKLTSLGSPAGVGLHHPHPLVDKKAASRDKAGALRPGKVSRESGEGDRRKPFTELGEHNMDSDMEDNLSNKSESEQPSPASSSSSSSSSFGPAHKRQVLGLRSIMQDLPSDENDDDSEEEDENDMDSDMERPVHTHLTHRHRRVSLSDGSDSENSSASSPLPRNEGPPLLKSSNQILEMKGPLKQKQEKNKTMDCDKAYLDELVELHKRLMSLRERHILQQIVNLIEETGHFHITNTTFDFDLCSLDRPTVRKLQSYLETEQAS
ncbi:protein AF-9 [Engraulis encrasicolus]|uniref:protein AF-9 n=1 Tax=Engraulis encrasicolus TaxID=184585 RepID=UPI002FD49AA4